MVDAWFAKQLATLPPVDDETPSEFFARVAERTQGEGAAAAQRYGTFTSLALGTPEETLATWVQTAGWLFQWERGLDVVREALPTRPAPLPARLPGAASPDAAALQPSEIGSLVGSNEYARVYAEKMTLWGQYLTAQLLETQGLDSDAMTTMHQEIPSLQSAYAYSVPTERALATLAKHAPLLEVGAGTGYWAHLLEAQGVEIVAADLPAWQERFNKEHRAQNGLRLMGEQRYTNLKVGAG